ncbi:hypothetical protein M407DRAFT_25422 [Tulasnella calospora MUT 4182]|uniref:Uncharacterized protein n=1 Tax=Tulasnella calospora MUT 4182 TaxID=1051891 RepID=A0A0C3KUL6_9AGAM|nr:hypothetical protein M407DRAFT_25422 [Tulasnella calospora MUT 4182]
MPSALAQANMSPLRGMRFAAGRRPTWRNSITKTSVFGPPPDCTVSAFGPWHDFQPVHACTPAASAARSNISISPPVPHQCNILVKNVADGSTLGYLSPQWNSFGEYGACQADQACALKVTFNASPDAASDELDFIAANGPNSLYPYFGARFSSSNDNLGPGNSNYAYIAGTTQSRRVLPKLVTMHSLLQPIFPKTWKRMFNLSLVRRMEVLVLIGDLSAFQNTYGLPSLSPRPAFPLLPAKAREVKCNLWKWIWSTFARSKPPQAFDLCSFAALYPLLTPA